MRIRIRKVLLWGTLLVLAIVAGGLGFAYSYCTDSATLAALIQRESVRYLPGSRLSVVRVLFHPLVGDVELRQVSLSQKVDGAEFPVANVAWLRVRNDFHALLHGEFKPTEIVVAHPTLRITRRKDGTWNLQGLLADPWPGALLPTRPEVHIRNGTVQLVGEQGAVEAVLREVEVVVTPGPAGPFQFEATAKGGAFDRLQVEGTFDPKTGRLELTKGDLTRLAISESLLERLPVEVRNLTQQIGLKAGEVDLALSRLVRDPAAHPQVSFAGSVALRAGTWDCPEHLPFPLDNVSAQAYIQDGLVTLQRAWGRNGKTEVRASGRFSAADPGRGPMGLHVEVFGLEIDDRLRAKTPPKLQPLWGWYHPRGLVNLALDVVRPRAGEKIGLGLTVDCLDVAILYHLFPYPVEHIRGTLKCRGESRIDVDVATTSVGGEPLTCRGTIDNPGPNAVVALTFAARSLPVDPMLIRALPERPDNVRAVVEQFHPSGSVRGTARLRRTPPTRPDEPTIGKVVIELDLDLNKGCAMIWDGLKYPVENLTGHLEIRPNRWKFTGMRGVHGLANIAADGEVRQETRDCRDVKIALRAEHLPFDGELRRALPPEWQTAWVTLNPKGSSRVDARVHVRPGQEHYRVQIEPEEETQVQLELTPVPGTPGAGPGGPIRLPKMEDVTGRFVYDNGTVAMEDVRFTFREAPVSFARGTVVLHAGSRFDLAVQDLEAKKLRLDADLRRIMPPVLAQFARRVDNGRPYRLHADLGIAWSGRSGEPARCTWKNAKVIFNDNAIQTGLELEHLNGQIDNVWGWSDGRDVEVHGAVQLDSLSLLGQQVTGLSTPLNVAKGRAVLDDVKARLLDGELTGRVEVGLDATPEYAARLEIRGADLERYTRTLSGRQSFRGLVTADLDLRGQSHDLRTLQGEGEARITEGDLGRLPVLLRLFQVLNLSSATKTAFDSAYVRFVIQNGQATLDPIKFTGNAFSLRGSGTATLPQGDLDLRLSPLYGRDERLHVRGLSDLMREASGQLFVIRVTGPASVPKVSTAPLPVATQGLTRFVQGFGRDRRRGPADGR
jgi:hypothetical protein